MKIELHLKSYHSYYLNNIVFQLKTLVNKNKSNTIQQLFLPLQKEKYTVLRSPHVDKKSREQFERITHKRVLILKSNNTKLSNRKYIEKLLS